jgi:hypothetical protein
MLTATLTVEAHSCKLQHVTGAFGPSIPENYKMGRHQAHLTVPDHAGCFTVFVPISRALAPLITLLFTPPDDKIIRASSCLSRNENRLRRHRGSVLTDDVTHVVTHQVSEFFVVGIAPGPRNQDSDFVGQELLNR